MLKRMLAGVGLLGGLVLLGGCGSESLEEIPPAVGVTEVAVRDDYFEPRVIQVSLALDSEVTWTWDGRRDHDVIGVGFQSRLQRDGTFTHRFTEPGTYRYFCTLHAGMTGGVIVTE